MSFRTCSWLLPQNEQRYGTLVLLLPVVVLTRSPSRCPNRRPGRRSALVLLRRWNGLDGRLAGLRQARSFATRKPGGVRLGDQRRAGHGVDGIDDAIVLRLVR